MIITVPKEFCRLSEATPTIVTVNEGEMLYLPAGWFHEVTSFGVQDEDKEHNGKGGGRGEGGGIHLALNYWM